MEIGKGKNSGVWLIYRTRFKILRNILRSRQVLASAIAIECFLLASKKKHNAKSWNGSGIGSAIMQTLIRITGHLFPAKVGVL